MLVSILVPVFNKEKYISKTLSSVISQTYKKWELIIVDDGSTDESYENLVCFKNSLSSHFQNRFTILRQVNQGQSIARYRALQQSKGDLIALLDGDDIWSPRKLELQVKFLMDNPGIDLVLSNYCVFPEKGFFPRAVDFTPADAKILSWAHTSYFGGLVESTGLFRVDFISEIMDPKAPQMSGGLEMCIRALQRNSIYCVKEYLCGYQDIGVGWHNNKEDLIFSYRHLSRDETISQVIRDLLVDGLEKHMFFWELRRSRLGKRLRLMLSLIRPSLWPYFRYALSTLSRSSIAALRYSLIYFRVKDLRRFIT